MFAYLKSLFTKKAIEEKDIERPDRCKVHESLIVKDPDKVIYYAIDSYATSQYVKLVENLSRVTFLTIIKEDPLVFQIGNSNIIITLNPYECLVSFHHAIIEYHTTGLVRKNTTVTFRHRRKISLEEAVDLLNDSDKLDVIFNLDLFKNSFLPPPPGASQPTVIVM
jgi:hypothetical protein